MNKIISEIWKYLDRLKGNWSFVGKLILGIFLLLLSVCYLIWRFPSIVNSGEKQIDTAVIAISAIIILLPFLSEIELFGVKFKKEIEDLEKETNEMFKSMDQRLLSIQSQNINQYFYQPKTKDELKSLSRSVQETVQEMPKPRNTNLQVDPELVHLFTIKWKIRKSVTNLYRSVFLGERSKILGDIEKNIKHHMAISEDSKFRLSTQQLIEILVESSKMNNDVGEILQEMIATCDSAYFGREVTPEQIAFVKENEYIIEYLESL